MGQSIAHSDRAERRTLLQRFLDALDHALVGGVSTVEDQGIATALDEFIRLTRSIDATTTWPSRDVSLERLPVCRFWDSALEVGARHFQFERSTTSVIVP